MPNILLVSATELEHGESDLFGIPIHIVGIGKVNAAVNTYKLIQKYKPDHVVNFGSCGNLKDYKVGEVLKIGKVYDDFYGCVVPEHRPIVIDDSPVKLFTTDIFYDTEAVYSNNYTKKIRKCDIVDMEGYSIAKVCMNENISVSLYKWISDDGDSSSWLKNATAGYNNFKTLLYKWLEQQK
tara:strand:+ start:72 stop:614 length:543 start_codon:yes stop_codon:yes gene_type:complete